jgi:hypothetical protein
MTTRIHLIGLSIQSSQSGATTSPSPKPQNPLNTQFANVKYIIKAISLKVVPWAGCPPQVSYPIFLLLGKLFGNLFYSLYSSFVASCHSRFTNF